MKQPPIVGIDLGTTYSLVALLQDGVPTVLPNALGELLTPSAVSVLEDGSIVVGAAARARATTHPDRTLVGFKRDMGTNKVLDLGGRKLTAQDLSALVLRELKHDAETALGFAIVEAVVTVPAYFGDLQRQATRDAGAIAGLRVERIVNEPTAAALAYGLHQKGRELRAVVLDLGGGTFDVTVIEIVEGVIEVQGSAGDVRLGGDDFDEALAERFAALVKEEHGLTVPRRSVTWARLIEAAEVAKRRLSLAEETRVALPDLVMEHGERLSVELTCTRRQAEEAWAPLIERLRVPITRALTDASLRPADVDEVLLVGGSTRMPCVARLASNVFGRLPLRSLPPDEAVAMGAAVQAALKEGAAAVDDIVVTDVAPFSMGIATSTTFGDERVHGVFTPILERGTVIPSSRERRFFTMEDDQREIRIEVFQGERSLCRDNTMLGELRVTGIPRARAGESAVDVRFTYDQNGILEVEATVVSTKQKHTLVLERSAGRLTKKEVEAARKAMARLKLHPRDALPNTTALARADALYVELTGAERAALGRHIAAFRAALEAQDEELCREARESLNNVTAALRRQHR
jgi:molecular chaperone HscC